MHFQSCVSGELSGTKRNGMDAMETDHDHPRRECDDLVSNAFYTVIHELLKDRACFVGRIRLRRSDQSLPMDQSRLLRSLVYREHIAATAPGQ